MLVPLSESRDLWLDKEQGDGDWPLIVFANASRPLAHTACRLPALGGSYMRWGWLGRPGGAVGLYKGDGESDATNTPPRPSFARRWRGLPAQGIWMASGIKPQ